MPLQGFTYKIVPEDDNIFVACPGEEDKFVDQFFDMTGLNFERVDEETIVVDGNMTWTFNTDSTHKIKAMVDVERENNGLWLPTPMTIGRDDFCSRMFIDSEYWYEYVKDLLHYQRVCPPAVGVCSHVPS